MRILAAMSGGVDSAVAAARAVEAGHEVVGVHLALSRAGGTLRTGSRGCCTIEDAMDARRAADRLGIPFYVWDFSERFRDDVIDDFVAEYRAGRTPNPCMRCNEKIKFAALLERALELGFDAVCTGHYATLVETPDGLELNRASDAAKDQSYVLGVLTAGAVGAAVLPRRARLPVGDVAVAPVGSGQVGVGEGVPDPLRGAVSGSGQVRHVPEEMSFRRINERTSHPVNAKLDSDKYGYLPDQRKSGTQR